jgi:hypothetical protein
MREQSVVPFCMSAFILVTQIIVPEMGVVKDDTVPLLLFRCSVAVEARTVLLQFKLVQLCGVNVKENLAVSLAQFLQIIGR